jgi:type IV secretory pathway component VirB8
MKIDQPRLTTHTFPRQISNLMNSNQFLNIFSVAALTVAILAVVSLLALGAKPPLVITINEKAFELTQVDHLPKVEDEIKQAASKYISLRYKWEPNTVANNVNRAKAFIHPLSKKVYLASISNVVKFSTEKQVSQRAYANSYTVNLQSQTVTVAGDRITSIQGLQAAGPLKVELGFESGERTKDNPWGIYFTKEKESL